MGRSRYFVPLPPVGTLRIATARWPASLASLLPVGAATASLRVTTACGRMLSPVGASPTRFRPSSAQLRALRTRVPSPFVSTPHPHPFLVPSRTVLVAVPFMDHFHFPSHIDSSHIIPGRTPLPFSPHIVRASCAMFLGTRRIVPASAHRALVRRILPFEGAPVRRFSHLSTPPFSAPFLEARPRAVSRAFRGRAWRARIPPQLKRPPPPDAAKDHRKAPILQPDSNTLRGRARVPLPALVTPRTPSLAPRPFLRSRSHSPLVSFRGLLDAASRAPFKVVFVHRIPPKHLYAASESEAALVGVVRSPNSPVCRLSPLEVALDGLYTAYAFALECRLSLSSHSYLVPSSSRSGLSAPILVRSPLRSSANAASESGLVLPQLYSTPQKPHPSPLAASHSRGPASAAAVLVPPLARAHIHVHRHALLAPRAMTNAPHAVYPFGPARSSFRAVVPVLSVPAIVTLSLIVHRPFRSLSQLLIPFYSAARLGQSHPSPSFLSGSVAPDVVTVHLAIASPHSLSRLAVPASLPAAFHVRPHTAPSAYSPNLTHHGTFMLSAPHTPVCNLDHTCSVRWAPSALARCIVLRPRPFLSSSSRRTRLKLLRLRIRLEEYPPAPAAVFRRCLLCRFAVFHACRLSYSFEDELLSYAFELVDMCHRAHSSRTGSYSASHPLRGCALRCLSLVYVALERRLPSSWACSPPQARHSFLVPRATGPIG
ncbi:hypothetical protein DFH09DRAFT_1322785 [Mycena vulgaris]|nr:hypothetical protein DFH09DRAFT_1322785 [Mycena vulgaris]